MNTMPQNKKTLHRFLSAFTVALLILSILGSTFAQAQGRPNINIIRDTEIENTLKEWMAPLLEAAGMGPKSVNLILVQSPQLNAFVAGGSNIFIYTGLIEKTKGPGELIGVMAHELGHISGGHLIATRAALERASYEAILGTVIGLGAAILGGNGEVGQAIVYGSQGLAGQRFLAHSRVHESSADQAALRYMESASMNPTGLVEFFRTLENEELLPVSQQSEYFRTHPLTRNRIDALDERVAQSPHNQKTFPEHWIRQHERMKAKLMGFINPERVVWTNNDRDNSLPARYAKGIAAYRTNHFDEAITYINGLIENEPENPYFLELKGQMLVDFGKIKEALPYYKKAVSIAPDAGLIRIAFAHALIESNQGDETLTQAIKQLEQALQTERRSSRARRLLATAHGRLGHEVDAKINLAEEAVLQGRYDYARSQAQFAVEKSEQGSRQWLQAKDILIHLDTVDIPKN